MCLFADVAYVLGGAVYHTSRDSVDNLRPGTIQELGNTVMGCLVGFTDALADPEQAQRAQHDAAYYFDLFWVMVRYPKSMGPLLHLVPALLVALAPALMAPAGKRLVACCLVARAMQRYMLAVVCAIVLPCMAGAIRVLLLGTC